MAKGKIRVATCQFAESFHPRRNAAVCLRYMRKAKAQRAEIVHFHEAALSGYLAHPDAPAPKDVDWAALRASAEAICDEARRLRDSGRKGEAEASFRRVLAIEPDRIDALVELGVLLWQEGRRTEGREQLTNSDFRRFVELQINQLIELIEKDG